MERERSVACPSMTGRLRWLIAAGFVLLFFLIPSPETSAGRSNLATLRVRAWLLDAEGPLAGAVKDGAIPPLAVEFRMSPPDEALAARCSAELARIAPEWATARTIEAESAEDRRRVDPALPALGLQVTVTDLGVDARLAQLPNGTTVEPLQARHPGRSSLLPAFLAIVLAILTRNVITSLFLGSFAGAMAWFATGGGQLPGVAETPAVWQVPFVGIWHLVHDTLWNDILGRLQVWDSSAGFQTRIILFVIFLFMAIGIMIRSGGVQGMVAWVSKFARGPVSTQLCTWITGLLIFFDDYSNCIIAGTTMQPLGDRNRVSREKISYIVDSTAAPIAGLSIFSTWIAYEISQYRVPLTMVTKDDGTPYLSSDAFGVFIQTLPYRFYCIFTLLLLFLVIVLRRDFGPMLRAERRSRLTGKPLDDDARPMVSKDMAEMQAPPGTPLRAINGLLPVLTLVTLTIGLIFRFGAYDDDFAWRVPGNVSGWLETTQWILGNSASEKALMYASFITLVVTALLVLGQRILTMGQVVESALRSAKSLGIAIVILLLAWCIGQTCKDLGTSLYLTSAFRDLMSPQLLPILMFLLAALVSFATGTSYGTMAILLPNVVILSHSIGVESGFGGTALMILTIGSVLEGSIFGDHCSPISDTTVLSSLGTQCDHMAHVQTQMPYALLAMVTATVCGYLPVMWIGPWFWPWSFAIGIAAMSAFLLVVGRNPARPA